MKLLSSLMLLLASLVLSAQVMALDCDPAFVEEREGEILISSNGTDDTDNIQCALDEAQAEGIPKVRLKNEVYHISLIYTVDWEGTLSGGKRDQTIINVLDNSVDCQAMLDEGMAPASMKFINGNVKVSKMTVNVESPCSGDFSDAPQSAYYLMHFTGRSAFDGCEADTGHGVVDRVDIHGLESSNGTSNRAVGAFAEGLYFNTCRLQQLGTLKLNRGSTQGFDFAAVLAMRASAQVDVNFNTFKENSRDIFVYNASQFMTVQGNAFTSPTSRSGSYYGIIAFNNQPDAPPANKIAVQRNTFTVRNTNDNSSRSLGVWAYQDNAQVAFDVAVNQNSFDIQGDETEVGIFEDVQGGRITGNSFAGNGKRGLYLTGDETQLNGWSVVNNDFTGLDTEMANSPLRAGTQEDMRMDNDCVLDNGTFENIWGPSQGGWVEDLAGMNFVLDAMMGGGRAQAAYGPNDVGSPSESVKRKTAKLAQDYALMKAEIKNDPMFTISGGNQRR